MSDWRGDHGHAGGGDGVRKGAIGILQILVAFDAVMGRTLTNNTPHASRQLCAPWVVTFLGGLAVKYTKPPFSFEEQRRVCMASSCAPVWHPRACATKTVAHPTKLFPARGVAPCARRLDRSLEDQDRLRDLPLNRHFYRYEPPRPLEVVEAEIKALEGEIRAMLTEVTA